MPRRSPARHLRILRIFGAIAALLAGCGNSSLNTVTRDVFASPAELDFGDVYLGVNKSLPLQLTNAGRSSQVVRLAVAPPFDSQAELGLPGGSSAELIIHFSPAEAGAFSGTLEIGDQTVTLRGVGLEVPECREPANPCIATRFDLISTQCVETPRPEGSTCTSRCVPSGVCSQGSCAGQFASCDDGDACSDDACSDEQGCMHTPKTCPASPTNRCRVGTCDPTRGCLLIDALDGASCGAKNCHTNTTPVCIAAQCVDRPLPTAECLSQFAYLKSFNSVAGDSFGNKVALSADGNTLAIGATGHGATVKTGAVYVFQRTGNTWAQDAFIEPANSGAGDAFGYSLALSADGNTLVVGAHLEDGLNDSAEDSGAVCVFVHSGGAWGQTSYLKASNGQQGDVFGASVAISADGTRLAVGATGEDNSDDSADEAGAVYLFERNGNAFVERAYVKSFNAEGGDLFGFSVALSEDGSTLAVGALGEDSQATGVNGNQLNDAAAQSGAVYLFHVPSSGAPSQVAYVKASNTAAGDVFGISLALSSDGNTLAVGAYGEDSSVVGIIGNQSGNAASQSGAVYLFRKQLSSWAQEAFIKASNTQLGDDFGYSLALSGDGLALAVGALSENSGSTGIDGHQLNRNGLDSGAVYLFRLANSAWAQDAYVKASNTDPGDFFGQAVALSADGTTLVSSAIGEDSNARGINGAQLDNSANESGAVYIFSLQ